MQWIKCEHMCKKSTGCVLKNTKCDELTKFQISKFDEGLVKWHPMATLLQLIVP